MKTLLQVTRIAILYIFTSLACISTQAASGTPRILMVVSSHGQTQSPEKPGYEFEEFAKAYLIFAMHGIEVDVASPLGGAVEADPYNAEKEHNARVLADLNIMQKLNNSLATTELKHESYQAVFVVGGKGAMFDLADDEALQKIIAGVYENQGAVAAVCHGPAALVNVKLHDDSYLVTGKRINSYTNQEEKLFSQKYLADYEFLLEDKLIERGGKFNSNSFMLSHVEVDERLITGQNPSSTVAVAIETVRAIGIETQKIESDREERTLSLIDQYLSGEKQTLDELEVNSEPYNLRLLGMYGLFYSKEAKTKKELETAVALMQAAQNTVKNNKLTIATAKALKQLGKSNEAKDTLEQLLQATPNYAPALELLASL